MKTKKILLFLFLLIIGVNIFATGTGKSIETLDKNIKIIQDFSTSDAVRGLFIIALAGVGIGLIANKDNERLKQRLVQLFCGIFLVLAAKEIVGLFFTSGTMIA